MFIFLVWFEQIFVLSDEEEKILLTLVWTFVSDNEYLLWRNAHPRNQLTSCQAPFLNEKLTFISCLTTKKKDRSLQMCIAFFVEKSAKQTCFGKRIFMISLSIDYNDYQD